MTAAPGPRKPDEVHVGLPLHEVYSAGYRVGYAEGYATALIASGQRDLSARSCCSSFRGQSHVLGECTSLAALAADEPAQLCRATNAGWMEIEGERFWVTDICGLPPHDVAVDHRSPSGETWSSTSS